MSPSGQFWRRRFNLIIHRQSRLLPPAARLLSPDVLAQASKALPEMLNYPAAWVELQGLTKTCHDSRDSSWDGSRQCFLWDRREGLTKYSAWIVPAVQACFIHNGVTSFLFEFVMSPAKHNYPVSLCGFLTVRNRIVKSGWYLAGTGYNEISDTSLILC